MSGIALIGGLTFKLFENKIERFILPLVAFSAGALIGGAFFHMIPGSLGTGRDSLVVFVWVIIGFSLFFALEQFLHWHHCNRAGAECKKPVTYLILVGDGLHNFIGGMAIAGTFLVDTRLGVAACVAAAAHELPQELGDMGVLVYGGWRRKKAVVFNFLSSLTFLAGGLLVYSASFAYDMSFLIPFAAGNFIYIGASDLVPEVNKHKRLLVNVQNFASFGVGIGLMLAVKVFVE